MSNDALARRRYFVIAAIRIVAVAGAVLGLILVARSYEWPPKILGAGIVLSALWVMGVVPRALAHRWRSPPAP